MVLKLVLNYYTTTILARRQTDLPFYSPATVLTN
jgi:hypothetical protein